MKVKLLFIAAMLCAAKTATANDAKISGRIKDANEKSAIIGATILLMQASSDGVSLLQNLHDGQSVLAARIRNRNKGLVCPCSDCQYSRYA